MTSALQKSVEFFGSQSALAREIGCTPQHVSLMLMGRRRVTAETAMRIAAATGGQVTLSELRPDLPAAALSVRAYGSAA